MEQRDLQSWKTVEKNFITARMHSFRSPSCFSPTHSLSIGTQTERKRLIHELIVLPLNSERVMLVNDFLHSETATRSYFQPRNQLLQQRTAPNPTIGRRTHELLKNGEEVGLLCRFGALGSVAHVKSAAERLASEKRKNLKSGRSDCMVNKRRRENLRNETMLVFSKSFSLRIWFW